MNITHYSVVKVFYTIQYRENVRNATRRTLFSSNTLSTVENPWRMLVTLSSLVTYQKASDFLHPYVAMELIINGSWFSISVQQAPTIKCHSEQQR